MMDGKLLQYLKKFFLWNKIIFKSIKKYFSKKILKNIILNRVFGVDYSSLLLSMSTRFTALKIPNHLKSYFVFSVTFKSLNTCVLLYNEVIAKVVIVLSYSSLPDPRKPCLIAVGKSFELQFTTQFSHTETYTKMHQNSDISKTTVLIHFCLDSNDMTRCGTIIWCFWNVFNQFYRHRWVVDH